MAEYADERGNPAPSVKGPLVRECPAPYRRRSGQVAAVLLYRNGGYSVWWPHRRDDFDKPWFGGPYTVFEVLLGRNVTAFELELPTAGDTEFFRTTARVHWEVADPYAVVRNRVWDAAELLHDELYEHLRGVSRRFRIAEAQRADEEVRAELASGRVALGADLGLRTRVHVFIDLSDRVREQVREGTGLDHQLQLVDKEHALEQRREYHQRRLVQDRARELEEVLRRGDEAEIAHHMARDPDRALEIRQLFRQEERQGQADRLALLTKMIDSGLVERHDIGEQMYEALCFLRNQSGRVLEAAVDQASAERRPPRALERGAFPSGSGRRRPFWEDDEDDGGDLDEDDGGDGEDRGGDSGQRAPVESWGGLPPDETGTDGQPVHRPTRVESATERAEEERRRRHGRPSDRFDDWDDWDDGDRHDDGWDDDRNDP